MPANAERPRRSPSRSCTRRRASRNALPRRLGLASSASIEREMSMAMTRLSPRVSVTIRSSPQRGPESATAASPAASPNAGAPSFPAVRAMRAVLSDHAAARRTRTRRAHAAAAHTAPATSGARIMTIGASNVIMARAPRMCPRGPARARARATRCPAARGTPLRSDGRRDAAGGSSRAD